MADIVKLYPKNSAKNPDAVLEQSLGQFDSVIVIGWNTDGELDVRASTNIDHKEILWMLSVFQTKLLNGDYF